MTGRRLTLAAGAAAAVAGGFLYRKATTPFPYRLRGMLDQEFPGLTRERVLDLLDPRPGEQMLEIGPGTGLFSLAVAPRLGPEGRLEVLDVQEEMLDHTRSAAAAAGIDNLGARRGDARNLPYSSAAFDAVFLVTVIGEIGDLGRTVSELRRVLRPGGRLVVGEFLIDWHAVPLFLLRRRAGREGLRLRRTLRTPLSYLARFDAP